MAEILVVDDDADIREALQLALELEGYAVETARHGGEAWERLRSRPPPALMLLDLAMPVLNGPGLLALLRADERLRSLPVVLITAFGPLAGTVYAGVQGFIAKPIELDLLLAIVARHCAGTGVAASSA